ncbi:hypothetical protein [Bacillus suaedae]|uniref:Uncharacterized protein n=1 Tax=Halalkalibacter suaedae TaxID=2822140 RepID=A0A940WZR2_9BACI|nr:hypothetical protein [Bacillus suaedae]MBP3951915.1 hypothetical protein [Bacillus suaedae]
MKKLFALSIVACSIFTLAACGDDEVPAPAEPIEEIEVEEENGQLEEVEIEEEDQLGDGEIIDEKEVIDE